MTRRLALTLLLVAAGCAAPARRMEKMGSGSTGASGVTGVETGTASYYAHRFHGRKTASGEVFDMHALTTAHPSLPFGSQVRVTNLRNGRSVTLRVNDRGPSMPGRIIDVSYEAARRLDFLREGLTEVRVEKLR